MSKIEEHLQKCYDNLINDSINHMIIYALTCIERQWKFYENVCDQSKWNDSKIAREIIDKIWLYLEEKQELSENDAEKCLAEIPSQIENDTINMSITVLENISYLIDAITEKNNELLIDIGRYNIDFIDAYLYSDINYSEIDDNYIENHMFTVNEIKNQQYVLDLINNCKDDKLLIEKSKNIKYKSIIS